MTIRRTLPPPPPIRIAGATVEIGTKTTSSAVEVVEADLPPDSYIGWDDDELWEATAETGIVSNNIYGPDFPFVARLSNVPPEDYADVVWTAEWADAVTPGSPVPPKFYSSGSIFVVTSELYEDCDGMHISPCNIGVLTVTADYNGTEYGPITLTLTASDYYDDYCGY